jgi:hypothetical protein
VTSFDVKPLNLANPFQKPSDAVYGACRPSDGGLDLADTRAYEAYHGVASRGESLVKVTCDLVPGTAPLCRDDESETEFLRAPLR